MNMGDIANTAKGILSAVAPTIASAFLGPMGGIATQKLIGALGLAPDSTNDQTMAAIASATPEQLLAIKTAEQEFILDMKRLDVDIMRLEAEDTASARRREVDTQDWTPRIIAAMILSLYILINYFIFSGLVLSDGMMTIAVRSLGALDSILGMIISYYFGSSMGSHDKNAQISSLIESTKK